MTSTKRPDGGELKPCPFCKQAMMFRKALWPSDGNIDAIIHAEHGDCGMLEFSNNTTDESIIEVWNTRTPANESPAPQATKKSYIKLLRTIVEIDARYADQIRDLLNVPAPQPPVEWLREALEIISGLAVNLRVGGPDYADLQELSDALERACEVADTALTTLASPSLTAGASSELRRVWLDRLNAIAPAVENLAGHQEQCDFDGVRVKVSRQALDEVLNVVNDLAVSFVTAPATFTEQPPEAQRIREALLSAQPAKGER